MISIICAVCKNNAIGKNNQLLFRISNDLKNFKKLTLGNVVIMGRKTYESIGKPLPSRVNIVISKNKEFNPSNVKVVDSLESAIAQAKLENKEIFIIGGGQIYAQAINIADKLYLTLINEEVASADTFFPDYKDFKTISQKKFNENGLEYSFVEMIRK